MKKRIFCLALAIVLCLSITTASLADTITPRQASGTISMSPSGRTISFSGYSTSAQTEDIIRITVILWEQRGSSWYEVARASEESQNTDIVTVASSKKVDGEHYYKLTGIHYSKKNGKSYSVTSRTSAKWVS